jgi:hypothetical protein
MIKRIRTGYTRTNVLLAIFLVFASLSGPSFSGDSKKAGPGNIERSPSQSGLATSKSAATSRIDLGPKARARLLRGLLSAYYDLIQSLRGGPGEGATPHISPTTDWKGEVRTNICNFQHECK